MDTATREDLHWKALTQPAVAVPSDVLLALLVALEQAGEEVALLADAQVGWPADHSFHACGECCVCACAKCHTGTECICPLDREARKYAVKAARNDALEEAARYIEQTVDENPDDHARAIRALKDTTHA